MSNYIKDTMKDILRHTHDLGIFEMVKIKGSTELTEVETVDADTVSYTHLRAHET